MAAAEDRHVIDESCKTDISELRGILRKAFSEPDSTYEKITVEEFLKRARARQKAGAALHPNR
jgi:L-amino acid N-acyltransferase YncA